MRLVLVLVLGTAVGCGRSSEPAPAPAASAGEAGDRAPVRTEVERGPVRVSVEVAPGKPLLSDEPTLTVTIDAAEGVVVEKPPFGRSIGGFLIRDYREPLPEVRDGRHVTRQVYTLEPTAPGEQAILPIPVAFEDRRPEVGDGRKHTVETEALVVVVRSLVGNEAPSLGDLRPPAPPIELPLAASRRLWPFLAAAAAAAAPALAVAVWLAVRRRRRRAAEGPRLSPAELAYLELEKLLADDPAGRGDLGAFYVELTAIVRRFIERTTGIRAAEQTTPEFLRAMRDHPSFDPERRARLEAFLEAADLVKFAGLEPGREEVEASFERAKELVGLPSAAPATAAAEAAPR